MGFRMLPQVFLQQPAQPTHSQSSCGQVQRGSPQRMINMGFCIHVRLRGWYHLLHNNAVEFICVLSGRRISGTM